ncbi:permease YjgP/YjgQ family protein [Desulfonatronospira thiodismutans ASO3-1]|uniref:Permease YjgP/YjgQ family protein n=1 Tax=Desulfonatronospira thiodismutans ASO3-1 TaxID=555779 RepID=D6SQ21_9BACT|nr:LPS export ABC transporter permease LptF [Desulfonatronospira thiodismutans]EFI34847.1 permease YjgP/YjgQ family protein [Desulfonatronospira thiodismutans ASO3-1]
MKILHRQIIKEVGTIFLVTLASMLSLIVIGRMIDLKDIFVGQSIQILYVIKSFFYLGPSFLSMVIPIACMLSIFLCFLRMSSDRELTALQTSGISIRSLVLSPLLFSLGAMGFTLYVTLHLTSWGIDNFRETAVEMVREQTEVSMQPGVFHRMIPDMAIYVHNRDPGTSELKEVFISDDTVPEAPLTIVAPTGRMLSDKEEGMLYFILDDGRIYRQDQEEHSLVSFGEYRLRLDLFSLLGDAGLRDKRPEEMSWGELQAYKDDAQADSRQYRLAVLEEHKRFSLPLACLILGLFAVPLGLTLQGLGRNWGLLLAMSCFLIYYSLFTAVYGLGEAGTLNPDLAMWMPNIFFLVLTLGGFYFYSQGREIDLGQVLRSFVPWLHKRDENQENN